MERIPQYGYDTMTHTRSCNALTPGEDCTCCLEVRKALGTEQAMHAAWRKRAEEDVKAIRSRYKWGSGPTLGKEYGVSSVQICRIVRGEQWR